MARIRSQLAIQVPPELLERLRAAASSQRRTVTGLVIDWIEAGLASAPLSGGTDLAVADRLKRLEEKVAELQATVAMLQVRPPAASAERVKTTAAPIPQTDELPSPAGAITTAELAERTGTNRAGWNNWASADRVGQVRNHPQAGAWRLVGQSAAASGGPMRWLWEPA